VLAGFALAIAGSDPMTRVAVGLAVGETAALLTLGFAPRS
jgi:hypothetical protein